MKIKDDRVGQIRVTVGVRALGGRFFFNGEWNKA